MTQFQLNRGMPQMPPMMQPMMLIVPGAAIGLLGLLVIYNPALLAYIVGGMLLLLGALLFLAGWRMKRMLGQ